MINNIDVIRTVDLRTKPILHKMDHLFRIGSVTKVETKDGSIIIDVTLSDSEVLWDVPLASINGLQAYPAQNDAVLIYCPYGRPENAIALFVISSAAIAKVGETSLSRESTQITLTKEEAAIKRDEKLIKILKKMTEILQTLPSITTMPGPGVAQATGALAELQPLIKEFP
jgi:phage gp45-like